MKLPTKKEMIKKLLGYEDAIASVQNWKPKDMKEEDHERIQKWKDKKSLEIQLKKLDYLSQLATQEGIMKTSGNRKLMAFKSMDVIIKEDVRVGSVTSQGLDAELKDTRVVKKGERVTVSFDSLRYMGIFLKIKQKGKPAAYCLLSNRATVEYLIHNHFEPVTKAYSLCSIMPERIQEELADLKVKCYKENSKGRKEYHKKLVSLKLVA